MNSEEFVGALQQLAKQTEIPIDVLVRSVEAALATAYKRSNGITGEVRVRIDMDRTADFPFEVFAERIVVDDVDDPDMEVSLHEARRDFKNSEVGDTVKYPLDVGNLGRIAAQTAKQVVVQRIREAERKKILDEYATRIGEVTTGQVQRREGRNILVNLGRVDAVLPVSEQVETEPYRFNDRIKVFILDVKDTVKGPQVIVSRTHPTLIRRLFELEVPEIADGTVVIKHVAREPGARSKIAVMSHDDKVDPVGACVGHRGLRVQAVTNELYGEKIDIIRWNVSSADFVREALSPARATRVDANEETKSAFVVVPDSQLSLAIGRSGQNVRLAARLTGWRIDIRSEAQVARGLVDGDAVSTAGDHGGSQAGDERQIDADAHAGGGNGSGTGEHADAAAVEATEPSAAE